MWTRLARSHCWSVGSGSGPLHSPCGGRERGRTSRNVADDDGVWTDPCAVADRHASDQDGAGADLDVPAKPRRPLVPPIGYPDRDVLPDDAAVADDSLGSDHDPAVM